MSFNLQTIERRLTHHMTHELQNSIGAMSVYLEMLTEETSDPDQGDRFKKLVRINQMLRDQVDLLRYIIPRADGQPIRTDSSTLIRGLKYFFWTFSDQIRVDEQNDSDLFLGGEPSALFQILYDGIHHCFQEDPTSTVSVTITRTEDGKRARIAVMPSVPPANGFESILSAPPLPQVELEYKKSGADAGFVLIWLLADV